MSEAEEEGGLGEGIGLLTYDLALRAAMVAHLALVMVMRREVGAAPGAGRHVGKTLRMWKDHVVLEVTP